MKIRTRAIRRHHEARIKHNRKHYWGGSASTSAKQLGKCTITLCCCSCWMCGNQRKCFGEKFSEKRQKLA